MSDIKNDTFAGRFYFKRTVNGNLLGEFSNNKAKSNCTESADLIEHCDGFRGTYLSTWHEDGEACLADLTIKYKDGFKDMFSILWKEKEKLIFEGEGFLCDDILIGNYWGIRP